MHFYLECVCVYVLNCVCVRARVDACVHISISKWNFICGWYSYIEEAVQVSAVCFGWKPEQMDSLSKAVSSSQSWPKNLVLTSACLLSEAVYIPHYTKKSKRKEGGGGNIDYPARFCGRTQQSGPKGATHICIEMNSNDRQWCSPSTVFNIIAVVDVCGRLRHKCKTTESSWLQQGSWPKRLQFTVKYILSWAFEGGKSSWPQVEVEGALIR